jgi:hypothetical protein
MKTFVHLSAAIVIGLACAGAAQATPNPDDHQSMPPPRTGVVPPSEDRSAEDRENPRVVTGRVLKVDAGSGTIVIQTPIGVIALRGPSEDLRDVAVGDIVQVEVVRDEDDPSASPPMTEPGEKL